MRRTSHRIPAALVLLLALGATAAPAAHARPIDPGPPPGGAPATHVTPNRSAGSPASLAQIQQGAEEAGLHPGVFGPAKAASTPAIIVRATAPHGGFDWGDAGIGAAAGIAFCLLAVGGARTTARRRMRHRVRSEVLAG